MKPFFVLHWRASACTQTGSHVSLGLDGGWWGEWTTKNRLLLTHTFRFILEPNNVTCLPWKMTWVTKINSAEKHMSIQAVISLPLTGGINTSVVSFFNALLKCESKGKHCQMELSSRTKFISRDKQKKFYSCISTYFSQILPCTFPRLAPVL